MVRTVRVKVIIFLENDGVSSSTPSRDVPCTVPYIVCCGRSSFSSGYCASHMIGLLEKVARANNGARLQGNVCEIGIECVLGCLGGT